MISLVTSKQAPLLSPLGVGQVSRQLEAPAHPPPPTAITPYLLWTLLWALQAASSPPKPRAGRPLGLCWDHPSFGNPHHPSLPDEGDLSSQTPLRSHMPQKLSPSEIVQLRMIPLACTYFYLATHHVLSSRDLHSSTLSLSPQGEDRASQL